MKAQKTVLILIALLLLSSIAFAQKTPTNTPVELKRNAIQDLEEYQLQEKNQTPNWQQRFSFSRTTIDVQKAKQLIEFSLQPENWWNDLLVKEKQALAAEREAVQELTKNIRSPWRFRFFNTNPTISNDPFIRSTVNNLLEAEQGIAHAMLQQAETAKQLLHNPRQQRYVERLLQRANSRKSLADRLMQQPNKYVLASTIMWLYGQSWSESTKAVQYIARVTTPSIEIKNRNTTNRTQIQLQAEITDALPQALTAIVEANGQSIIANITPDTIGTKATLTANLTLHEGRNVIDIQATNLAGRTSQTSYVITLDSSAPELEFTELTENPTIENPEYQFQLTSTEQVIFRVNNEVLANTANEYIGSIDLVEGENILRFTATDIAGNTATHIVTRWLDGDLLPDFYETNFSATNPRLADTDLDNIDDGNEDFDNDGLTNYQEYLLGTRPFSPDTDHDGLSDGVEVFQTGTDPTIAITNPETHTTDGFIDMDGDGLINIEEINAGSSPLHSDSDLDGLEDGFEVEQGTSPVDLDSDDDGLLDEAEQFFETNPLDSDTGDTGILDGEKQFTVTVEDIANESSLTIRGQGDIRNTAKIKDANSVVAEANQLPGLVSGFKDFTATEETTPEEIRWHYNEADLNDMNEDELKLYYFDDVTGELMEEPVQGVNTIENYVWAEPQHLSVRFLANGQGWEENWHAPWEDPEQVYSQDARIQITANVHNLSEGTADNVNVNFYAGNSWEDKLSIGSFTIPFLNGPDSYPAPLIWNIDTTLPNLFATVDENNIIIEMDESNNQASRVLLTEMNKDSDADGLTDYEETQGMRIRFPFSPIFTDPFNPDTDGDGLEDGFEMGEVRERASGEKYYANISNPSLQDTDADGVDDFEELEGYLAYTINTRDNAIFALEALENDAPVEQYVQTELVTSNPRMADTDLDGLNDLDEREVGSNPNNRDSDNDGIWDGKDDDATTFELKPPEIKRIVNIPLTMYAFELYDEAGLDRAELVHGQVFGHLGFEFTDSTHKKGYLVLGTQSRNINYRVDVFDVHGNVKTFELTPIQDLINTPLGLAPRLATYQINNDITLSGRPRDIGTGGLLSGLSFGVVDTIQGVTTIVTDPINVAQGLTHVTASAATLNVEELHNVLVAFNEHFESLRTESNPFTETQSNEFTAFNNAWSNGYFIGMLGTGIIPVGGTASKLRALSPRQLATRLSEVNLQVLSRSIKAISPKNILLAAEETLSSNYRSIATKFTALGEHTFTKLWQAKQGFASKIKLLHHTRNLRTLTRLSGTEAENLLAFLSKTSRYTKQAKMQFINNVDNAVVKKFSNLSNDIQADIFFAAEKYNINNLSRHNITTYTNGLKNVSGIERVVKRLKQTNWQGIVTELEVNYMLQQRGHILIEIGKKTAQGEFDSIFRHLNGRKVVAEIKGGNPSNWIRNGRLDRRTVIQLNRYIDYARSINANETWFISRQQVPVNIKTLIEHKGFIVKHIWEI